MTSRHQRELDDRIPHRRSRHAGRRNFDSGARPPRQRAARHVRRVRVRRWFSGLASWVAFYLGARGSTLTGVAQGSVVAGVAAAVAGILAWYRRRCRRGRADIPAGAVGRRAWRCRRATSAGPSSSTPSHGTTARTSSARRSTTRSCTSSSAASFLSPSACPGSCPTSRPPGRNRRPTPPPLRDAMRNGVEMSLDFGTWTRHSEEKSVTGSVTLGCGEWGFRNRPMPEWFEIATGLGFRHLEFGIGGGWTGRLPEAPIGRRRRGVSPAGRAARRHHAVLLPGERLHPPRRRRARGAGAQRSWPSSRRRPTAARRSSGCSRGSRPPSRCPRRSGGGCSTRWGPAPRPRDAAG